MRGWPQTDSLKGAVGMATELGAKEIAAPFDLESDGAKLVQVSAHLGVRQLRVLFSQLSLQGRLQHQRQEAHQHVALYPLGGPVLPPRKDWRDLEAALEVTEGLLDTP